MICIIFLLVGYMDVDLGGMAYLLIGYNMVGWKGWSSSKTPNGGIVMHNFIVYFILFFFGCFGFGVLCFVLFCFVLF